MFCVIGGFWLGYLSRFNSSQGTLLRCSSANKFELGWFSILLCTYIGSFYYSCDFHNEDHHSYSTMFRLFGLCLYVFTCVFLLCNSACDVRAESIATFLDETFKTLLFGIFFEILDVILGSLGELLNESILPSQGAPCWPYPIYLFDICEWEMFTAFIHGVKWSRVHASFFCPVC